MSDGCVSKVILSNNWGQHNEEVFEIFAEEFWLNFSNLVKFYKCIFKHGLIVLIKGLNCNLSHVWEEFDELSSVFALSNLKEIWYSLESC